MMQKDNNKNFKIKKKKVLERRTQIDDNSWHFFI